MDQATIILAFISKHSVDRRGYIQRELRAALEKYPEKLIDDIFLIPVMLDDIEIPVQVKALQVLYEKDPNCLENIKSSIVTQLIRLGDTVTKVQEQHNVSWTYARHQDTWDGLPGYDVSYQLIRLSSSAYPHIDEINHIIRGRLSEDVMGERRVMFEQSPSEHMNFGKAKFWRTNTYDATCTGISIVGNVISIEYTIYMFTAGAAHGQTGFHTFVFIIDPTFYLKTVEHLFIDPKQALPVLQSNVRDHLLSLNFGSEEEEIRLQEEWVQAGTTSWEHFSIFSFIEEGLSFTFVPYQVSAYAFGPQRAILKWRVIRPLIKNHILCALNREFEHFDEKNEAEQKAFRQSLGTVSNNLSVHENVSDDTEDK